MFSLSCDFTSQLQREILRAQEYINTQEYKKSAEVYENLLKKSPPQKIQFKILFQLAELNAIHLGRPDKSINYLTTLLKNSDDLNWLVKAEEKRAELYF